MVCWCGILCVGEFVEGLIGIVDGFVFLYWWFGALWGVLFVVCFVVFSLT